jgi:hypothetical protein
MCFFKGQEMRIILLLEHKKDFDREIFYPNFIVEHAPKSSRLQPENRGNLCRLPRFSFRPNF